MKEKLGRGSIKGGSVMLKILLSCIFSAVILLPVVSSAQFGGAFRGAGLRGFNGAAGFGFAEYDVKSPSQQFKMDNGMFAYLGGERAIDDHGLFLTISFNYMKTKGESSYNYTTLAGTTTYQGSNISFESQNYQLGLGLKKKFFHGNWTRPFIEVGGLFGFHEMKHKPATGAITCGGCGTPDGYKQDDTLTGFGYYGEVGFEIDFSESYGVRVGGRYQETETRKFETLGNQKLKFTTLVFQFAIQRGF